MTAGTPGGFEAHGYHVGVYGGAKVGETLIIDALVAYTRSDYDNRSGATTGSFNADRITVAAHVSGSFEVHSIVVMPTIGFMYASENQKAYTDSAGIAHAAQTVTAGRFSVGPKVQLPDAMLAGEVIIMPWVAAKFEYDFSNAGTGAPNSGLPDFSNLSSARVLAGLDGKLGHGFGLKVSGSVAGLGSGAYTSYGGSATLSKAF